MAQNCTHQTRPKGYLTPPAKFWLITQGAQMPVGQTRTKTNMPVDARTFAHGLNESSQPIHDHVTLAVSSKQQCNKL